MLRGWCCGRIRFLLILTWQFNTRLLCQGFSDCEKILAFRSARTPIDKVAILTNTTANTTPVAVPVALFWLDCERLTRRALMLRTATKPLTPLALEIVTRPIENFFR